MIQVLMKNLEVCPAVSVQGNNREYFEHGHWKACTHFLNSFLIDEIQNLVSCPPKVSYLLKTIDRSSFYV